MQPANNIKKIPGNSLSSYCSPVRHALSIREQPGTRTSWYSISEFGLLVLYDKIVCTPLLTAAPLCCCTANIIQCYMHTSCPELSPIRLILIVQHDTYLAVNTRYQVPCTATSFHGGGSRSYISTIQGTRCLITHTASS